MVRRCWCAWQIGHKWHRWWNSLRGWLWVFPMARMCCTRFSLGWRWCIWLLRQRNCLCLLWILILAFFVSVLGWYLCDPVGVGRVGGGFCCPQVPSLRLGTQRLSMVRPLRGRVVCGSDFVVRRWPFGKLRDHAAVTTKVWPLRGLFCLIFEYHFEAFEYHFALLEYHFLIPIDSSINDHVTIFLGRVLCLGVSFGRIFRDSLCRNRFREPSFCSWVLRVLWFFLLFLHRLLLPY